MLLPYELHIAAALTLVRSKPAHLSIQDYIQALKQSIRISHREGRVHRTIDHSLFWRNQHDTLRRELEKERDAAFVLKQQNEALEAQVAQLLARSKPGRKRKLPEQEEPDGVKRMKAGTMAIAAFGSTADVDPVIKILRHVHCVQTLCKGRMWSTESEVLAYNLIQAMEALSRLVERLPSQSHSTSSCSQALMAIARSCITVFYGLKRMSSLTDNDNFSTHVVCACVHFFDVLCTSIEEAACVQVGRKRADRKTPMLEALATLASSLVENLQASAHSCPTHAQVLEGTIYHILHRLGEATHELLLDGPRNDDIEKELQNLPLPEEKRLDPIRQTEMRAILTSAPLLIATLRKAVLSNAAMPLAEQAHKRLQRTLVDSIFGPGTRGPNASQDVLRLPKALGAPPICQKAVRTEDIPGLIDSFEMDLWTLIGWDVLGREDDVC